MLSCGRLFWPCVQETGQAEEALATFSRALTLNPAIASSNHRLGLYKLQSNDFHGALQAYTELLNTRPNDHVALTNRGLLLMNHAQSEEVTAVCWRGVAFRGVRGCAAMKGGADDTVATARQVVRQGWP